MAVRNAMKLSGIVCNVYKITFMFTLQNRKNNCKIKDSGSAKRPYTDGSIFMALFYSVFALP